MQRTATHDRGCNPVAALRHIHDVEQDVFAVGLGSHVVVRRGLATRIDGEERSGEISGTKGTWDVIDVRTDGAQSRDLLRRDLGIAEHDAAPSAQVKDDRVVRGVRHRPAFCACACAARRFATASAVSGGCRRHSLSEFPSHHQRPARSFSPGAVARVHGAQPIDV